MSRTCQRTWGRLSVALLVMGAASCGVAAGEIQPAPAENAATADRYGDPLPLNVLARLGTVRFRPGEVVHSVAFSPDGKTLAAASRNGRVGLWDVATGRERLYIVAHPGHADASFSGSPCVAFSPDGKTLATAGNDRAIRFWDPATAKELGQFQVPDGGISCIAYSPDGKSLASAGVDTTVLVWEVAAAMNPPGKAKAHVLYIRD